MGALKLLRTQSTIYRDTGCFAASKRRFTRTQTFTGHFLSSAYIKIFPKQQDHLKQHLSSFSTNSLPPVSVKQKLAVAKLITGSGHVVINACAGSGKTTTILQIAAAGNKKLLVFMYNRRIMQDTISRAENLRIGNNITVYTYHRFGCEFYSSECFTDQGLKRVLENDMQPRRVIPPFDILVLDEQQDMNPILYEFVRKVTRDATGGGLPQFLFLGDPLQEIYTFNNADIRFLTMAKEGLFQNSCDGGVRANEMDWTEIRQTTSYRMTKQIAKFINEQVLRPPEGEEILTVKNYENPRPRYLICDISSDGPLCEILRLVNLGVSPSQIIVLVPSLRKGNSIRHLANQLALRHPSIPVHISINDDFEVSPLVIQGKVVFATYHQAKGIEREAAIVFGFDRSYHTFYRAKQQSVDNPQYVAITRASTHLVVIHDSRYEYLPFIDRETLHESCEVVQLQDITPKEIKDSAQTGWAVTSLTRNISDLAISDCFPMLELGLVGTPELCRYWPATEIEVRKDIWECVADITGTAIPAIYEWQAQATCSSFSRIFRTLRKKSLSGPLKLLPPEHIQRLRGLEKKVTAGALDIADILYLANVSNAVQSGYIVKVLSIPFEKYTWFTTAHAKTVYFTLRKHIPTSASYENDMMRTFYDVRVDGDPVRVFGRTDVSTCDRVWEVKWTMTLRPEHVLQLSLYGAITKSMKTYYLINVPTKQVIEVKPKRLEGGKYAFIEVLRRLVTAKSEETGIRLNDEEFREEAASGFKNFIGKVTVPTWLNSVSKTRAAGPGTDCGGGGSDKEGKGDVGKIIEKDDKGAGENRKVTVPVKEKYWRAW